MLIVTVIIVLVLVNMLISRVWRSSGHHLILVKEQSLGIMGEWISTRHCDDCRAFMHDMAALRWGGRIPQRGQGQCLGLLRGHHAFETQRHTREVGGGVWVVVGGLNHTPQTETPPHTTRENEQINKSPMSHMIWLFRVFQLKLVNDSSLNWFIPQMSEVPQTKPLGWYSHSSLGQRFLLLNSSSSTSLT